MGNCCGSEAEMEAVRIYSHHPHPQGLARSAMAAPNAQAAMSAGLSGNSPSVPMSSSGSSDACGANAGDGVYLEGRILETPNLHVFTFGQLRAATKNFKPDTVLGEGGFGRVYKGWVDEKTMSPARSGTGMVIAVKKLNPESMQGLQEWQSEVNFLGRLSHPNLVRLLGYCLEDKELLLVYEFMAKGSLENHLFRKGGSMEALSWGLRLRIAIGVARGLAFLHSSEKQVIYRDFKTSNILLDTHYKPKLSDFGLAKNGPTGGDSHVTTRVMGTYGYAAPEYVATGHLYVKSDVYGFGVVMLEMLTGLRAHDKNRPSSQYNLVDWTKPYLADRRKLARIMDPRLEGRYHSMGALQAAHLTLRCLSNDPKSRPSMEEVVAVLEEIELMKARPKGSSRNTLPLPASMHHHISRTRSGSDAAGSGSRSSHPCPRVR